MPRIRTLKPECHQHEKVGGLSDRAFRLWIGVITQADDEGREVGSAAQLRTVIWGYHPRVRTEHVEADLRHLDRLGLIRLYRVDGRRYLDLPSWFDHQRINRPTPSTYPPHPNGLQRTLNEPSVSAQGGLIGDRKDRKDLDRKDLDRKEGKDRKDLAREKAERWLTPSEGKTEPKPEGKA